MLAGNRNDARGEDFHLGVYSPVNHVYHDDEFDGILVRFKGRMIIKSKDAYPFVILMIQWSFEHDDIVIFAKTNISRINCRVFSGFKNVLEG